MNQNGRSLQGIASGNFDNDTETDIVVINNGIDSIIVFLLKYRDVFINEISCNQTSAKHPHAIITAISLPLIITLVLL